VFAEMVAACDLSAVSGSTRQIVGVARSGKLAGNHYKIEEFRKNVFLKA